jgi:hypothetical protein
MIWHRDGSSKSEEKINSIFKPLVNKQHFNHIYASVLANTAHIPLGYLIKLISSAHQINVYFICSCETMRLPYLPWFVCQLSVCVNLMHSLYWRCVHTASYKQSSKSCKRAHTNCCCCCCTWQMVRKKPKIAFWSCCREFKIYSLHVGADGTHTRTKAAAAAAVASRRAQFRGCGAEWESKSPLKMRTSQTMLESVWLFFLAPAIARSFVLFEEHIAVNYVCWWCVLHEQLSGMLEINVTLSSCLFWALASQLSAHEEFIDDDARRTETCSNLNRNLAAEKFLAKKNPYPHGSSSNSSDLCSAWGRL